MTFTATNSNAMRYSVFVKLMKRWAETYAQCTTKANKLTTIEERKKLLQEQGIKSMPIELMSDIYDYSLQA